MKRGGQDGAIDQMILAQMNKASQRMDALGKQGKVSADMMDAMQHAFDAALADTAFPQMPPPIKEARMVNELNQMAIDELNLPNDGEE